MSKELIAAVALGLSLIGAIFAGGTRIGTLTERIENQTKQIDDLDDKIDALSIDLNGTRLELMRLMTSHLEPSARPTGRSR